MSHPDISFTRLVEIMKASESLEDLRAKYLEELQAVEEDMGEVVIEQSKAN